MAQTFVDNGRMVELTAREMEILVLLHEGLVPREVAVRLVIAVGTVRWHIKTICGRLEVHGVAKALAKARKIGVFDRVERLAV
ncbi:MAG: helix-turn-helix domain-containing protein [Ktedonobacterales bacterium]